MGTASATVWDYSPGFRFEESVGGEIAEDEGDGGRDPH